VAVKVLVVVPTYNEAPNIERMLSTLRDLLPGTEVLVVDDGSPDGTATLVRGVASELGGIHLLERQGKDGLGSAYRAGFAWGLERGFDAFVEIDADFSHDPKALPQLLETAEAGADVVIGSRYVKGGSIPEWKWHRHLLSWGGNKYSSLLLGLKVADATAGFRVYRASALRAIDFSSVQAGGYGFQIEMTYRARLAGQKIVEVPIAFVDREHGESKMSSHIAVEALGLVTRWGVDRIRGRTWRPPVISAG
jgi:dolichol-phosphate mannosyltransferase